MILTFSNLHPRPDQPQRGMYNAQLFEAMAAELASRRGRSAGADLVNICPVPGWRVWDRGRIRRWVTPRAAPYVTRYVPVLQIPVLGRNSAWRAYAAALRRARPEAGPPESILATWLYPDGAAAAQVAEEWGCPACVLVQGSDTFHLDHPVRRRVILAACARAAGVICVCDSLADCMRAAGVPAEKVHVAPNGVDGERFRYRPREEALRRLGAAAGPLAGAGRVVLFVGNLVPVKGPDVLIEAWRDVRRDRAGEGSGVRLCLVGDGPWRARLERRCRELGYGPSVAFVGRRPHEEVPLWMNAADCLCLPSRSEGMPNVVVEALASGLPTAGSAVGAAPQLLADEPGGRLMRAGDAAGLAAAVGALLGEPVDRPAMAERNRDRFSWRRQASSILSLLGNAVDKRRGLGERGIR